MEREDCLGKMAPQENPLVNNKKLRQMYAAMVGARILDEYVAGRKGKRKKSEQIDSTRGEEACRVSTAIELIPGDLVSDDRVGVAMDFIAGATASSLLRRVAFQSNGQERKTRSVTTKGAAQMPWIEDVGERLRMAEGAALAFKALKIPSLVVCYVRDGEVASGVWRRVLGIASKFELPILFVVLPGTGNGKRKSAGDVRTQAHSCRVPCIPVDASDAVALYRVAQESIGRARGDGGPVVIQCVAYKREGRQKANEGDPILQMKSFMLGRKVCSEAWMDGVGTSFRKRLGAAQ